MSKHVFCPNCSEDHIVKNGEEVICSCGCEISCSDDVWDKETDCQSCGGTGFTGIARTFDETCSCCLGTGALPEASDTAETA